jgi:hypothetical protein
MRSEAEFNEAMSRITANKTLPSSTTPIDGRRVASASRERAQIPRLPRGYESVPLRDAGRYVGESIRIIERDGLRYKGTLAKSDGSSLVVERILAAGTVTFEISKAEIEALEVYFN